MLPSVLITVRPASGSPARLVVVDVDDTGNAAVVAEARATAEVTRN
jgi:hypothetical protein